jgi:serine phosphatase RsbU (regulator of sigma subunit)
MTRFYGFTVFFVVYLLVFLTANAQTQVPAIRNANGSIFSLLKEKMTYKNQYILPLSRVGWRYCSGDSAQWKNEEYDDAHWLRFVNTQLPVDSLPKDKWTGIAWFRLTFKVEERLKNQVHALMINQTGASEIYLDGLLLQKFGKVGNTIVEEKSFISNDLPVAIYLDSADTHTLAIRFSNQQAFQQRKILGNALKYFGFEVFFSQSMNDTVGYKLHALQTFFGNFNILGGIYLSLWVLHLLFFLFFQRDKINVWFSLFTGVVASLLLLNYKTFGWYDNTYIHIFLLNYGNIAAYLFIATYLGFLYSVFYEKQPKYFHYLFALITVIFFADLLLSFSLIKLPLGLRRTVRFVVLMVLLAESLRIIVVAIRQKKPSAWIIGGGVFILGLTIIPVNVLQYQGMQLSMELRGSILFIGLSSLPFSMAVYIARQNAKLNFSLLVQVEEVKQLSAKTLEQEKEKQTILANQKAHLEEQVIERTHELQNTLTVVNQQKEKLGGMNDELSRTLEVVNNQKYEIEATHKNITASIAYAKRIQQAMLPLDSKIASVLGADNFFLLFRPRDVVSGDFYWFNEIEDSIIMAVADCTGHGVPGALMSMVGNQLLYDIVVQQNIVMPNKILNLLHSEIRRVLKQNETQNRDGMDIAIITWNMVQHTIFYAGAMNSIFMVMDENFGALNPSLYEPTASKTQMLELKADKKSIGGHQSDEEGERIFKLHQMHLAPPAVWKADKGREITHIQESIQNKNTQHSVIFYLYSDGYQDQFGGKDKRKFMIKRFRELLSDIHLKPMEEQKNILNHTIDEYMQEGQQRQIDDILVFGFRIWLPKIG